MKHVSISPLPPSVCHSVIHCDLHELSWQSHNIPWYYYLWPATACALLTGYSVIWPQVIELSMIQLHLLQQQGYNYYRFSISPHCAQVISYSRCGSCVQVFFCTYEEQRFLKVHMSQDGSTQHEDLKLLLIIMKFAQHSSHRSNDSPTLHGLSVISPV